MTEVIKNKLLKEKQNIDNKLINIIADIMDKYDNCNNHKCGRKKLYDNKLCATIYLFILKTGVSYEVLHRFNIFDSKLLYAAEKRFYKYSKKDLFKSSYTELLKKYYDNNKTVFFNTDTSNIKNEYCVEKQGFAIKLPNKLSSSLATINDDKGVVFSVKVFPGNTSDVKTITPLLDDMLVNVTSTYHNPIYLSADKGYISEDLKQKLKSNNIILNTPVRDNQKRKLSSEQITAEKNLTNLINKNNRTITNDTNKINNLLLIQPITYANFVTIETLTKCINQLKIDNTKLSEDLKSIKRINKRSQRIQFTKKKSILLKKRITIEHFFGKIKKSYKKCEKVYNKFIKNYMNYLYIAFINYIINVT